MSNCFPFLGLLLAVSLALALAAAVAVVADEEDLLRMRRFLASTFLTLISAAAYGLIVGSFSGGRQLWAGFNTVLPVAIAYE